ncbi:MAG: hypothetical protein ACT4NJ_05880 [Nitrosopumilaceae archaeon]
MPRRRRRNDNEDWIAGLLALGIGFLAVQFLSRLGRGSTVETTKTCMYCGYTTTKWARMCPRCRNTFSL